jgi:hypothetical protein
LNAFKNRLGLMIAMATCVVALAVPAAGRTASITRCDIRAGKPVRDGHNFLYGSKITCNGSVTLDDLVTKLQKRSAGSWHVVAKQDWGPVEVRHPSRFLDLEDLPEQRNVSEHRHHDEGLELGGGRFRLKSV